MGRVLLSNCGVMPASFFETLASCVMVDDSGNTFLNVICYNLDCTDFEPAIQCGDDVSDPEAYTVAKAFGVDSCGYPALKLRVCVDADSEVGGELV